MQHEKQKEIGQIKKFSAQCGRFCLMSELPIMALVLGSGTDSLNLAGWVLFGCATAS